MTKRSLRALALGPAAALALSVGFGPVMAQDAPAPEPVTVTFTFVQTNDIDRMEESDGRGGFARLATVVEEARAAGNTFFILSGDTISPSLLSGIDKGEHIITILNQMAPDVMVPGNHEFDFGPQVFRDRMAEVTFDVVSSNIFEADGSQPANTIEDKIVEIDGVTIGFYGLTTEDTPILATAGDMSFEPTLAAGVAKAEELRAAGADFVVAVVHTPLAVDMLLAREGAGDLILSGHDEHLLAYYDGRVAVTESASQADYVVVTEITLTRTEEDGDVSVDWHPNFRIVDTATVEPNAEVAATVQGFIDQLDEELQVEIGTTETPLDSRRAVVRGEEAAIGNLIADAVREAVDADVSIIGGGGIRADKEYPAGSTLTRADIFAELPFGNTTVKLEVTGQQIWDALENGFSQVTEVGGRFPQVSGLTVEADLTKLPFERVTAVTIGGQPIDLAATYTLATNDYMANGGDGYTAFVGATNLVDAAAAQLQASQVISYIEAAGTISPEVEGRIVLTR
jgi:2',3'-cyclic-nucleotide 2'-phosphodiesterase (5'-nucleotidase family)